MSLFAPFLRCILHLIPKTQSSSRNCHLQAILLVGGFGSSPYLYKELDNSCMAQGIPVIWVEDACVSPSLAKITYGI